MNCPSCGSEEVLAAELFELRYELAEDGTPGELVNSEDVFEGPGQYYYLCCACDHHWDREGAPLAPPAAVPGRL